MRRPPSPQPNLSPSRDACREGHTALLMSGALGARNRSNAGQRSLLWGWVGLVFVCLWGGNWQFLLAEEAPPATAPTREQALQGMRELVTKFCLDCHGADDPAGSIQLTDLATPADLLRERNTWEAVQKVLRTGQMPPPDAERPAAEDQQATLQLLKDLFDEADRSAPPRVGKVTVRRLNRTEYNNTIRDLMGVDFSPAADFPADDIGHGFDNIGDVLTISPVLMERYLAAAEQIVQRAITPTPPPVPNRHISTRYVEPASANIPWEKNVRKVSTAASDQAVETGPLFTRYKLRAGEYVFKTKLYVTRAEQQPVDVVILAAGPGVTEPASEEEVAAIHGKAVEGLRPFMIIKRETLTPHPENKPETIEVSFTLPEGIDRMAVGLIKVPEDEPQAEAYVEFLALQGPLDTRPESHRRLLAVDEGLEDAQKIRVVLERFLEQAFRRPVTPEERERHTQYALTLLADGMSWEAAIQQVFQAVLVSPKFLFRLELDDRPLGEEPQPLDEFQLASRLSYFLWSSLPDAELFELARNGELTENLEAQVRRMLRDPKAETFIEQFSLQWLQLQRLQTFMPDPRLFPQFNEPLRQAMLRETELFFGEIVREDRSILDLIQADFTYLNEPLARHYGIADTNGNRVGRPREHPQGAPLRGREFHRVSLPGNERGGLLTQASVLTVTSNPTRTSPVKRGRWVLEQILGSPPPPPPPDVPELEEGEGVELTGSLRERMQQHMEKPSCAACHSLMDPLGLAFENFNAIGAFREKEGEFPIDASGTLPDGKQFQGPRELQAILLEQSDLFSRALTEKMLIYALGRGLEPYDRAAVAKIQSALSEDDYRFSRLVVAIVQSDPFRLRPGKD